MIYLAGALVGILLGFAIPYGILVSLGQDTVGMIVGLVVAIILAFLCAKGFMKIMKPLIIIETALFGMALAFEAVAMLLGVSDTVVIIASFVGFVFGIPAAKYQFSINEGRALFERD